MADSKASKLRLPSKIGRPCCTVPPKPALPPSPPRSTMNSMETLWESHGRRLSEAGLRRESDNSVVLTEDTDSFIIGDRVWVGGTKPGSIAYIGETQFAPGDWAGVVLDEPIGKNDGSVAGSRYFQCEPKRGIFSRLTRLTRQPLSESMLMSPTGEKTPTSPPDGSRGNLNKSMSPSLNASTTSLASVSQKDVKIGDRVIVSSSQGSKTGVLRFVGTTEFAPGEWCGIELDDPVGKNDGSVGEIRYFECRPKHGLFAPSHKVSRSPSSRRTSAMCVIHKPTGASMNSSLRRYGGSRESLLSMSSVASTNASIATRGISSGSRKAGLRTSTPARNSLQDMLKEKQQEIEMLRKERDFERERISKAAAQADNAEQNVIILKQEYDKYREDMERRVQEAQMALEQLLEDRNSLKAHLEEEKQKSEDLLFRFEEESVNKDDIQNQSTDQCVINALNEDKMRDLEKTLSKERERVIQLEQERTNWLATEEELTKLRNEFSTATNLEKQELEDIRNRNLCLEEAKITLEKQMLERNDLIERYAEVIKNYEAKIKETESLSLVQKVSENDLEKKTVEMEKHLMEKNELVEKLKEEHELDSTKLRREIEQLKEIIDNITKDNVKNKESLIEEYRKIIADRDTVITEQNVKLKAETQRHEELHKSALEKLRADSAEQMNQLAENFKKELLDKDSRITNIVQQLEEKSAEIERLAKELSLQRDACLSKDEELKILMERVEDLSGKLKASEEANNELTTKINNLQSHWKESVSNFDQEKHKLEESVASLLASSTESTDQIDKLSKDLKTKEIELVKLRDAKAAEIEELKKNFQSQIEDKTKYIREINADISQKSIRLNALETEVANLKALLATKDEEIENLSRKMSELQDAITLSEQTKTNLESELRMYDVNIAELNNKLSRAEEKTIQLTEQKAKLEAEIESVISTSTNSSDQLVKYNEDLRAKEKELDEIRDGAFKLENSLASAESKIASINDELNRNKGLVQQYRTESEELKNKLAEEVASKDKMRIEIDGLKAKEQELLQSTQEKESIRQDLKDRKIEISELMEKLRTSEEGSAISGEKYSTLEKEYNEMESRHKSLHSDLEKKIALLEKDCENSKKIVDEFKNQRVEMEESTKELKKNVDDLTEGKKKLEISLNDKNCHLEKLESEIAIVKDEREEARSAMHSLNAKYNEILTQLEKSNSSRAQSESETSLELIRLKEEIIDANLEKKNLLQRLEQSETSANELHKKLNESADTLRKKESKESLILEKLRTAENSSKKFEETLENSREEFKKKLDENNRINDELRTRVNLFETESVAMKHVVDEKNKTIEEITRNSEEMKLRLEKLENVTKSKEEQTEGAAKLANEAQTENKVLREKIDSLNKERISQEAIIEDTKKEIESLRQARENLAKNHESEIGNLLALKQNKIDELDKENEHLRNAQFSMEKNLKLEQEKVDSLSNLLNETEISSTKSVQGFQEQLNLAKTEVSQLRENQNRLEKENKQLAEKWNQALEDLKTFHENRKNNEENENYPLNKKILSAAGDMNQNSDRDNELKKLAEDNETYRSQIDFLNSVIVDMQRKNETLLCKIEVLQMGVPANEADDYSRSTLDKRTAAPRMFCDICDQFDLHETEDCPRQAQDFEEPEKPKKSPKKPPVERPYCENCERFGHDTNDCDDTETF